VDIDYSSVGTKGENVLGPVVMRVGRGVSLDGRKQPNLVHAASEYENLRAWVESKPESSKQARRPAPSSRGALNLLD